MIPLAFDLGATSGRAAIGRFDGEQLTVEEVHRFANDPVQIGERLHWDILRLYHEIKQGFLAARVQAPAAITSFGIDSWGIDFGLLDSADELIGNPYHYRDSNNPEAADRISARITRGEMYARTGIQFLPINTLNQLEALRGTRRLAEAATLLQIPDLLRFFLTGEKSSEYTIATTTQLLSIHDQDWDRELLEKLDLPHHMLGPLSVAPMEAGPLRRGVAEETGIGQIKATIVAEHDTASAVAAIPSHGDFAYVSCGTWALLGTELRSPILDERALQWNFTNEGGIDGTYRVLKNICGLWLLETCRRTWSQLGKPLPLESIHRAVSTAEPFRSLTDPDHPAFFAPTNMEQAIQNYCAETSQPVPYSRPEILRCIHESLAFKFRFVLDRLEALCGHRFSEFHIVGGGSNNVTLCQFTANAIGRPVVSGPAEATVIGNLMVQLMATGSITTLPEARAIVGRSFPVRRYEPEDVEFWDEQFHRFCTLLERES